MALALALLAAGPLAFLLARHAGTATASNGSTGGAGAGLAIENQAASWVASQVSKTAIVSCDRVMCQSLAAHGVPAALLLELKPRKSSPLRSSVIVATAAVRGMLGNRLGSVYAPAALATFGSGSGQISIRVIAPQGAAGYSAALKADIQARKESGAELLRSQRIAVSPTARGQLADGQVDSRLLVTIAGLAATRPVSVVGFGDLGPGASPGIPLRSADLAETAGPAGASRAAQVHSMLAFLRAQRGPYLIARARTVRLADGRAVLRIEFAAPSPLGLLGPGGG